MILRPQRFVHQPQYPTPVDYSGLGYGMKFLLNPGVGPIDLVTGRKWTPNGNVKVSSVRNGKLFDFDGTGDYYSYTGYPELVGNKGTFFFWLPKVGPNTGGNGHMLLAAQQASSNIYVQLDASGYLFFSGAQLSGTAPDGWYNTTNRSLVISCGGTAATSKAYFDGAANSLTFAVTPRSWLAGNKALRIGSYQAGPQWDFNGTMRIAGHTSAVWGKAEAKAFHNNISQLYQAPPRRIWIPASSGGSAHDLTAANATQSNAANAGVITQAHAIVASSATQANTAGAGAISQAHAISANPATQGNAASSPTITQVHALTSVGASQANTASGVAITVGASVTLVAAASSQANAASAGAVTQAHVLVHAPSIQDNVAASSAIVQAHILAAANAVQANAASAGAISLLSENNLAVSPVTQGNIAGTGQITRAQTLTASNLAQTNKASSGAISDGIIVEAALITGITTTTGLKKPGIPADAPAWLRTMTEILIGRRGNKIEIPAHRDLSFSATPTKAECEALYSYANEIRTAVHDIISRFDS